MDVLLMLVENYVGDEGLTTLIAGLSDAHVYCLDVFLQSKFTTHMAQSILSAFLML